MEDALTLARPLSSERTARRERWRLDHGGFDALLNALDPDRQVAAERYGALRERLSRFFEWKRADDPDALADEALDRLARRISAAGHEDEAVRQPEKFAAGVARMLLREQWRGQRNNVELVAGLQAEAAKKHEVREEQARTERLSALLEECLERLPAGSQELIRRYYSAESRAQMDGRKRLAEELDISLNALRNRALRIRGELEREARRRLDAESL